MVVRWFLVAEIALFGAAALMHAGILLQGHEHLAARTAETVIALVLLGGLLWSVAAPVQIRLAGFAAQTFALLGTLVGLFTIVIGIGPRTSVDLILHATMIVLLVAGLFATRSARPPA
jgi:hypothetical protein